MQVPSPTPAQNSAAPSFPPDEDPSGTRRSAGGPRRAVPFNALSLIRSGVHARALSVLLLSLKLLKPDRMARDLLQLYFARWLVLPPSVVARVSGNEDPKKNRWYLLFISDFSGDTDQYLTAFAVFLWPAMNAVWWNCVRWPGTKATTKFLTYVEQHLIRAQAYFNAYGESTIRDVLAALRVSAQVEDFVLQFGDLVHGPGEPDFDDRFQHAFQQLLLQVGGDLAS